MRQAANRRSRFRPESSLSHVGLELPRCRGHEPERQGDGAVPRRDVGFAVAQQPRKPALGGRRELVDVVEEQRARPGLQDGGAAPQGLEVGSVRPFGSGPEQLFVDVSRFSGAAVNGDDWHPPPAAALKALEQLLRAQSGLRQQQHRRAPGRGERERRAGTARRVRPADQWQRDLDRARRAGRPAGRHFQSGRCTHQIDRGQLRPVSYTRAISGRRGRRRRESQELGGRTVEIISAIGCLCQE